MLEKLFASKKQGFFLENQISVRLQQKMWQPDCNYAKRSGSWTAITPKEVVAGLQITPKELAAGLQ